MIRALLLLSGFAALSFGQSGVPVVLLNGYEATCGSSGTSTSVFGQMEQLLRDRGLTTYYFDNCTAASGSSGRPSIEQLGQAFGQFLEALPFPQVDVVAHSMGGLIVRAYIEGLQPGGKLATPAVNRVRKAVLIGAPNSGALALVYFLLTVSEDAQLEELLPGSQFTWTLNTANQNSFDFRGTDALAIAGDAAGTDQASHTSDGVVPLTSASLARFVGADHVRVIAGCHVPNMPKEICDGPGIAFVNSASHPSFIAVNSFLSGTDEWRSVGQSADTDPVLSTAGGIQIVVEDSAGNISHSVERMGAPQGELPGNAESGVFFGDLLRAGDYDFVISGSPPGAPAAFSFQPTAGFTVPVVVKNGPSIDAVLSATGALPGLSRAPGMLVAIYGSGLSDVTLTVGGLPVPVLYSSDTQLNAVLPESLSGVVPCVVAGPAGMHSINVVIEPVIPALFTSGTDGSALAFHQDGSSVSGANSAAASERILIYATGIHQAGIVEILLDGTPAGMSSVESIGSGLDVVHLTIPANLEPGEHVLLLSAASHQSSGAMLVTR